jgi:hypothetical protein
MGKVQRCSAGRGAYRCFGRRAEEAVFSRFALRQCLALGYADSMRCMRCLQPVSLRPRRR